MISGNAANLVKPGAYNPALDGLRFFAFLLVFVHHGPKLFGGAYNEIRVFGWVGVDLFFVLSAYLLFKNFVGEHTEKGRIDVPKFYLRRILRIYPLLVVYVAAMLAFLGPRLYDWERRVAGLLLFFDNIIAWWRGFNGSIHAASHLWTLSFEFQFYLFLPLLFFAYLKMGLGRFTLMLGTLCVLATLARAYLFANGAEHPIIYVTPFLRPEAVFAGLLVAVYRPRWHYGVSAAIAVAAGAAAYSLPVHHSDALSNILQFPLLAVCFGSVLDVVLRSRSVNAFFCWKVFTALGTISYGLYVIHYAVRHGLRLSTPYVPMLQHSSAFFFIAMFSITVFLAAISYRFIELPFLRRKVGLHKAAGYEQNERSNNIASYGPR